MNIDILVAAGGVVLSACVSYFVARLTAKNELKKQEREFAHSDANASDRAFSDMAKAVSNFMSVQRVNEQRGALSEVGSVRAVVGGELGLTLDLLFSAIQQNNQAEISKLLNEAIYKRRELQALKASSVSSYTS